MIRIFFTDADLARFRMATTPNPMWEMLLSLHLLQSPIDPPAFRRWRLPVRRQLSPLMRPLFELAPAQGYSPDFLTPPAGADGLEPGIDGLLSTPRARLRADLRQFARYRRVTNWTRALAEGDADSLRQLADTMRRYHRVALAPYWTDIRAEIEAERSARARALAESGFEGMMASLHPDIRWRPPVLEVHGFTISRDVRLDGRGLQLIPSFFCWRQPILLRDPELPPVLVYPVEHRSGWLETAGSSGPGTGSLGALLGRTRAAVLQAVGAGCTTTELARRVGVSPATASQHASVLRDAGLITTRRHGGSVLHSLHPLGAAILSKPTLDRG
jgi:DNA-binding transcriptional ArsR family regulator